MLDDFLECLAYLIGSLLLALLLIIDLLALDAASAASYVLKRV